MQIKCGESTNSGEGDMYLFFSNMANDIRKFSNPRLYNNEYFI